MNQMNSRLRIILLGLVLLLNAIARSQGSPAKLSLREAVDIAIKNNLQIKQSELRTETADINRKQSKAFLLPNLNGNFNYGWNNGRNIDPFTNAYVNQQLQGSNISLSGQWNIFNGLQVQNSIRQNTLAYEASEKELQQAKETLTLNVILNYLQVLNNEDLLVNTNTQAAVSQEQVDRLEVLVKEGARGPYLLADLKGQLANEQVAIINAQNSLDLAKLTLSQLLNIPYNKSLQLERDDTMIPVEIYHGNPEEIYAIAQKNLPVVKASELRIKSAEKGVKVEQSQFFPQIGLYGNLFSSFSSAAVINNPTGVTDVITENFVLVDNVRKPVISPKTNYTTENINYRTQMSNNVGSSFGIQAAIPLFNNFRTKYRIDQARVNVKIAETEKQNIELQLKQNIEQAHANMTASYNRYKAYLDQYNNYQESFRANEIRFNAGAINSVEYLTAKNNFDRATISLGQVRYEYLFRTKILDYYQGRLTL
jgi:outer membrane protein